MIIDLIKEFPYTKNSKRVANSSLEAKPFLQWVGGKREMIPQYKNLDSFYKVTKGLNITELRNLLGNGDMGINPQNSDIRELLYYFNDQKINFVAVGFDKDYLFQDNAKIVYVKIVYLDKTEEYILKP